MANSFYNIGDRVYINSNYSTMRGVRGACGTIVTMPDTYGYYEVQMDGTTVIKKGSKYLLTARELTALVEGKPTKALKPAPKAARIVGRKPQTDLLLEHFETKPSISAVEASALYRIRSLSRRINDLEERGYDFHREHSVDPTGQRYVRYHFGLAA